MQILTNLTSSNQDVFDNIDQYVGGIYVQMVYNVTNQDTQYTYYKAVDCSENDPNYDESWDAIYKGFLCPDLSSFNL